MMIKAQFCMSGRVVDLRMPYTRMTKVPMHGQLTEDARQTGHTEAQSTSP